MTFTCSTCGRQWDAESASQNEYECLRKCGGTLRPEEGSASGEAEDPLDHLPYPAALAVRRFMQAPQDERSAWDRITLFKEAVEATVKGFCVYGVGAYLAGTFRSIGEDERLLSFLVRPSLGHWVELLGGVLKLVRTEPDPARSLYGLFFAGRGARDTALPSLEWLRGFVAFRNDLHHGARRAPREYAEILQGHLPGWNRILEDARFLAGFPLLRPTSESLAELWSGWQEGRTVTLCGLAADTRGRFGFIREDGVFVDVEPLAMGLHCTSCFERRLFLYDSQKSYRPDPAQRRAYMLEYDGGHRPDLREPIAVLEERFSEELMLRAYRAFRNQMVVVERYARDFSTLVQSHQNLIGREFLHRRIERFIASRDRGLLVVEGEPGIGKTAWVADRVRKDPAALHFFYRHASGLRSPDDFVNSLLHGLARKHGLELDGGSRGPLEQRAQLQNLLPQVSERLDPERPEIILVDALDEAGPAFDGANAVQLIPSELPPFVYFVVTSRPHAFLDLLAGRADCERFVLEPVLTENVSDAYEYVQERLSGLLDMAACRRVADLTQWNFLLLRLLCDAILDEDQPADEIEALLIRYPGVQDWYSCCWERLQDELQDQPSLLSDVEELLSILVAADSSVSEDQICAVLHWRPARFSLALRPIRQYLDVATFTAPDPDSSLQRELTLYRLYHDTFREFLLRKAGPHLKRHHEAWAVYCQEWRALEGHERQYALRSLPRHLLAARLLDQLDDVLTDLEFLEQKVLAGMAVDLARDFHAAETKGNRLVEVLGQSVSTDISEFAAHPETFFQTLWNRAWWFDAPAAVPHYEFAIPGPGSGAALSELLEHWRRAPQRESSRVWLRSLRPPRAALGGAQKYTFRGFRHPVRNVHLPPGRKRLLAGSDRGEVLRWDLPEGTVSSFLSLPSCEGLAFHPDSRSTWNAASSSFSLGGGDIQFHHGSEYWVSPMAFSTPGDEVVYALFDGSLHVLSLEDGQERLRISGEGAPVRGLAVSPDGRLIIAGGADGIVRVYDWGSGESCGTLVAGAGWVNAVAVSRDSRQILTGCGGGDLVLWGRTESGDRWCELGRYRCGGRIWSVDLAPDGRRLAASISGGDVLVFDVASKKEPGHLQGHTRWAQTVTFSPDGSEILTASGDGTARIWDSATLQERYRLDAHEDSVYAAAWSSEGRTLVTGSRDKTVITWSRDRLTRLPRLRGHSNRINCLVFSADGRMVASGSADRTVRLWSPEDGREVRVLEGHQDEVQSVAFGPTSLIASGGRDRVVRVWSGLENPVAALDGHDAWVNAVAFSADGSQLASADDLGGVAVWDTQTWRLLEWLEAGVGGLLSVAFSPDGQALACGSRTGTLCEWRRTGGHSSFGGRLRLLHGHRAWVTGLCYEPTSERLLSQSTGYEDTSLRTWDLASAACLSSRSVHTDVGAAAQGSPWSGIVDRTHFRVEAAGSGEELARMAASLHLVAAHPTRPVWALANRYHLYLLALEPKVAPLV